MAVWLVLGHVRAVLLDLIQPRRRSLDRDFVSGLPLERYAHSLMSHGGLAPLSQKRIRFWQSVALS